MVAINGYNFNVLEIVDYLRPFRGNVALSYDWGSPKNSDLDIAYRKGLYTSDEMDTLLSMDSSYERNVYIKKAISKKLADPTNEKEADYYDWIVKVWGGIRAYNKTPEHVKKCINTLLDDNYLGFDGIASMSKIASFMFPDKYIIYDARVCYSLNWILLKHGASDKYFPDIKELAKWIESNYTEEEINTYIKIKEAEISKLKEEHRGAAAILEEAGRLEKEGETLQAIALYERLLEINFDGSHPYDRLAIRHHRHSLTLYSIVPVCFR